MASKSKKKRKNRKIKKKINENRALKIKKLSTRPEPEPSIRYTQIKEIIRGKGFKTSLKIISGIAIIITLSQAPLIYKALVNWWHESQLLKVSIRFYEERDGRVNLLKGNNLSEQITLSNIKQKVIEFPLRLAVRNEDNIDLEVVGVELIYDARLNIRSKAQRLISTTPGRIVYNHPIGTLPNREGYTPLEEIDVLLLENHYFEDPIVVIFKPRVPAYLIYAASYLPESILEPDKFNVNIRVYCKNRKPIKGNILLSIGPWVGTKLLHPPMNSIGKTNPVTKEQIELWNNLINFNGKTLDHWTRDSAKEKYTLEYKKISYNEMMFQVIEMDKIPRRIICDIDNDNYINFELYDEDEDGKPDKSVKWPDEPVEQKVPMVDWIPESVSKKSRTN